MDILNNQPSNSPITRYLIDIATNLADDWKLTDLVEAVENNYIDHPADRVSAELLLRMARSKGLWRARPGSQAE